MWQPLTAAEVLAEFNLDEKAGFDAADGASDTLAGITARVVEMVRGDITAGGYPLGAAGTLPSGLKSDAIAVARWRFLLKLPKAEDIQNETRQSAYKDALDKLKRVAAGQYAVEEPTVADDDRPFSGSSGTVPRFKMRTEP